MIDFDFWGKFILLIYLVILSLLDVKYTKINPKLTYGLMIFGLVWNCIVAYYWDWKYILYSIAGFLLLWGVGLILFSIRMWGGADSKVMMGIGAMISFKYFEWATSFIVQMFFNLAIVSFVALIVFKLYKKYLWKDIIDVKFTFIPVITMAYFFTFIWGNMFEIVIRIIF